MTDAYERFQTIEIRTPDDVPPATPLEWQAERIRTHESRGLRGTAADTLAALAIRENMRRHLALTGLSISDARRMGATWEQIAGRMWATKRKPGEVAVGQFAEADLTNFHNSIKLLAQLASQLLALPPDYLSFTGSNPTSARWRATCSRAACCSSSGTHARA